MMVPARADAGSYAQMHTRIVCQMMGEEHQHDTQENEHDER